MPRSQMPLPFNPQAEYHAVRALTLASREYKPGDKIDPTGLTERTMRNLHAARRIAEGRIVARIAPAAETDAPPLTGVSGSGGTSHAPSPAGTVKPRHVVKRAGLGGFKVIGPGGQIVGDSYPDHASALAAAKALNGSN